MTPAQPGGPIGRRNGLRGRRTITACDPLPAGSLTAKRRPTEHTIDVRDFGAVGDGQVIDSPARLKRISIQNIVVSGADRSPSIIPAFPVTRPKASDLGPVR